VCDAFSVLAAGKDKAVVERVAKPASAKPAPAIAKPAVAKPPVAKSVVSKQAGAAGDRSIWTCMRSASPIRKRADHCAHGVGARAVDCRRQHGHPGINPKTHPGRRRENVFLRQTASSQSRAQTGRRRGRHQPGAIAVVARYLRREIIQEDRLAERPEFDPVNCKAFSR